MKAYKTKAKILAGTDYREVYDKAKSIFLEIKKKSKRKPYVRSAYFNKDKIFLDYFWEHLHQKNWWDQTRRLKFYTCALDLITHSRQEPTSKENVNKRHQFLHRFAGVTQDNELFFVQIVEDRKTDRKFFISVFPMEELNKKKKKKTFR